MALPEKFYDIDGNETTLEHLCKKEPEWAANRIRQLTNEATKNQPTSKCTHPSGYIKSVRICGLCGKQMGE